MTIGTGRMPYISLPSTELVSKSSTAPQRDHACFSSELKPFRWDPGSDATAVSESAGRLFTMILESHVWPSGCRQAVATFGSSIPNHPLGHEQERPWTSNACQKEDEDTGKPGRADESTLPKMRSSFHPSGSSLQPRCSVRKSISRSYGFDAVRASSYLDPKLMPILDERGTVRSRATANTQAPNHISSPHLRDLQRPRAK